MRMQLNIKLADNNDYIPLSILFVENNIPSITRFFNPFPLTSKTASDICQKHRKDFFYVAYYDNRILGMAMLRGWEEGCKIPSFGILVDKNYHHMGIGKQITIFVLEEAKKIGCPKIRLSVFASNYKAILLYQSIGFYEISREIIFIDGEKDEKIIMIKELAFE